MKAFRQGLLATLPLTPGVIAFGLFYGVMARQIGFSPWEAWAMSLIVHAGSAQFIALGMWATSGAFSIVLTTLIVNLRHLLMGASIAPHLRQVPPRWRALLALWMSDESYALAIAAYERGEGSQEYFFGSNVGIYLVWPLSGLLGALLGGAIPDPSGYGLDMLFPLTFLGLLTAFLKDGTTVVVALAGAAFALLATCLLPGSWGVVVAGLVGSALGPLLEEVAARWKRS